MKLSKLRSLPFSNNFVESLPGDPITENYPRQVENACYSTVQAKQFPQAHLISHSGEMAEELGLDPMECKTDQFTQVFSGSQPLPEMIPYASCYGGHQFGHWAGQLGDGRAINLGEVRSPTGQSWTLQLKGAGPTPYSRTADGLAVLRSSVREYLCSEAMHHLGVPGTRALSLIGTGDLVERDMLYDGNPKLEPGAIVCRAAPSFLRFGNFELLSYRNDIILLSQLIDYSINNNFKYLGAPNKETYLLWFQEVSRLTREMLVHWMRVGFVHGVMNTDNMSILGLTIDYGPYGWLENYDPNWTPNTTDAQGKRYRFGQQPQIALWNLLQLANAIYPLIGEVEPLEEILEEYKSSYELEWRAMMANKLGLQTFRSEGPSGDRELIQTLLDTLQSTETDMTIFFRNLATLDAGIELPATQTESLLAPINEAFYQEEIDIDAQQQFINWLSKYHQRLQLENTSNTERQEMMNKVNPKYVLRNYLAQLAIDKSEQGDHSLIHELEEVLQKPYSDQEGKSHLAQKRPEWARNRAGCSMLSCSS